MRTPADPPPGDGSATIMKKALVTFGLLGVMVLFLAAWNLGWLSAWPSVAVRDVRKAETLLLGKETRNHFTHGISLRGSGYIDGNATISLLSDGKPVRV